MNEPVPAPALDASWTRLGGLWGPHALFGLATLSALGGLALVITGTWLAGCTLLMIGFFLSMSVGNLVWRIEVGDAVLLHRRSGVERLAFDEVGVYPRPERGRWRLLLPGGCSMGELTLLLPADPQLVHALGRGGVRLLPEGL